MKKYLKNTVAIILALLIALPSAILISPKSSAETLPIEETNVPEPSETKYNPPIDMKQFTVPDSEVPDLINYEVAVQNNYMRRAYEKETALNEVIFQKTDGSFVVYTFAFPVKYRVDEDTIADKAPELSVTETLTADGYRFATLAKTDTVLKCADIASGGIAYTSEKMDIVLRPKTAEQAEFEINSKRIDVFESIIPTSKMDTLEMAVIPVGYTAMAESSTAQSALSVVARETLSANYTLSEGNEISVVPSYNGFQTTLHLAKSRTQEKFYFEISTNGQIIEKEDSIYVIKNSDGSTAGLLGDAMLFNHETVIGTAPMDVTESGNGTYFITVEVPSGSTATAVTLSASDYYDYLQDTTVYSNDPTNVAGYSSNLYVGYNSSRGIQRILIRPSTWSAPSGYTVSNATLYVRDIMGANVTTTVECRQFLGEAWWESSANWNVTSPNSYGTPTSSVTMNSDNGWSNNYVYSFNVTSIVQNWFNDSSAAMRGIMLKASSANEAATSTAQQYLASTQYGTEAYRPYITISASYSDTIDNGVYYIRSAAGGYLTTDNSCLDYTNVYQRTNKLSSDPAQSMNQLWRVTRLGNGYYCIRPYHYTPSVLTASQFSSSASMNVDIYRIGYYDTVLDVPSYGMWNIGNMRDENGNYGTYFSLTFLDAIGLDLQNYNGTTDGGNITIGDNYGGNEHKWVFEPVANPPQKVMLYNPELGTPTTSCIMPISNWEFIQNLFQISISTPGNIHPAAYTWSSSNTSIITVDSPNLKVIPVAVGSANVTTTIGNTVSGFRVDVQSIRENIPFYIQNKENGSFMHIQNDIIQNNNEIVQYEYTGKTTSQWVLDWYTPGYYTIHTVASSGVFYYLTAGDNGMMYLSSTWGTPGTKWSIISTSSDGWKLVPFMWRNSNFALSIQNNQQSNNTTLQWTSMYTSNEDCYDEWYFWNCSNFIVDSMHLMGLFGEDSIVSTDDGFWMTRVPLSYIMHRKGLTVIQYNDEIVDTSIYFDDWYIFAVSTEDDMSYGLLMMREQEYDLGDGNDPKVKISFVEFDVQHLLNCITVPSIGNQIALTEHIDRIISDEPTIIIPYSTIFFNYFKETASNAPYLIAEEYCRKIATDSVDGTLSAPSKYLQVLAENSDERLVSAVNSLQCYNGTNQILIGDSQNLSMAEKCTILATHTGDVNFHSFAAEVQFHAQYLSLFANSLSHDIYYHLLRADLCTIEGYEWNEYNVSGLYDVYHDLNSELVRNQADAHREYEYEME